MAGFSKYPSQIDSSLELPPSTDNVTPVKAEVVNRLRDSILAIESELGTDPSREFGTVRARLDFLSVGGGGGGSIEILQEGSVVLPSAIGLDFVGNVNVTVSQPLRARIQVIGGQATQVQETLLVINNSQTSFTLSQIPIQPNAVVMFVDGIKQQYGVDYVVSNNAVTYGGVALLTTDEVEFWYLVDIGGISSGTVATPAKMRVFSSINISGNSQGINKTMIWDSVSNLIIPSNINLIANTFLSPATSGHFLCQGQLTIESTVDAVANINIDILLNGIQIQTLKNNGNMWSIGLPNYMSFSFTLDLQANDQVSVRWHHKGSNPSMQQVSSGDQFSWFGLSEI